MTAVDFMKTRVSYLHRTFIEDEVLCIGMKISLKQEIVTRLLSQPLVFIYVNFSYFYEQYGFAVCVRFCVLFIFSAIAQSIFSYNQA